MAVSTERSSAPPEANKVIGYAEGYVILQLENDPGLYFCELDEELVSLGENLPYAQAKPIYLLDEATQAKLISAVSDNEGGEQ